MDRMPCDTTPEEDAALAVYAEWKAAAVAALKDSIEHWRRLSTGTEDRSIPENPYGDHCACCQTWCDADATPPSCAGCPIAARTGKGNCEGTPWWDAEAEWNGNQIHSTPAFRFEAKRELAFLIETLRLVEIGEVRP